MWGLVKLGQLIKIINYPQPITIEEVSHPESIFSSAWSDAERKAIGILPYVYSGNNRDDEYYSSTYRDAVGNNAITRTYTNNAKNLSTIKENKITEQKSLAHNVLSNTDWYVVRKEENSTAIPSQITAFRTAVRTNYAALKTAITNAANVAAVEALWSYTASANSNKLVTVNGTSSGVVNTSTNTITSNGHAFVNNELLEYNNGGGANIGGLVTETSYYVYARTTNTFKLSHSHSNCGDAAAISLTGVAGSGTAHKFTSRGIPGAGLTNPNKDAPVYSV
jgi:hypothetical protein